MPPRRVSFVGRTADLPEVAARLGRYPVVTLTGVGGVGKTALADLSRADEQTVRAWLASLAALTTGPGKAEAGQKEKS